MSKLAAAQFIRRVFEDEALKFRVQQVLMEPDRDTRVTRVAQRAGFAFDDADFRALRDDVLGAAASGQGELGDGSLDEIAGGSGAVDALMRVVRDSAAASNDDKRYCLQKLKGYHSTASALADGLRHTAAAAAMSDD